MTAYRVTILHDACTTHDVDADTESAAIEAAMNEAGVSLCYHCSGKIEMGDPIRAACVENLSSGESNTEADPDYEVVQLRARVAELEAMLKTPNARVQAGTTAPQPDPERDEAARRGASPGTKC